MLTAPFSLQLDISVRFIAKTSATLLSLLLISSASAATLSAPESSLVQTLGSFELTINNKEKNCLLKTINTATDEARTIPLLLEAPCYWISNSESKTLRHFSYEAVKADNTVLVAGTPLDWSAEKKSYQKLPDNAYCTQHLQGIIISKDQVFAVDEKMIAAHCETGLAIDEKIFHAMAHNPERYQEKAIIPAATPVTTNGNANKAAEILNKVLPDNPPKAEDTEEKSFLDTVKEFFSGKDEKTK